MLFFLWIQVTAGQRLSHLRTGILLNFSSISTSIQFSVEFITTTLSTLMHRPKRAEKHTIFQPLPNLIGRTWKIHPLSPSSMFYISSTMADSKLKFRMDITLFCMSTMLLIIFSDTNLSMNISCVAGDKQ
jgi:hypothetical protein